MVAMSLAICDVRSRDLAVSKSKLCECEIRAIGFGLAIVRLKERLQEGTIAEISQS